VRKRARLEDFAPPERAVVDALVTARLLTADQLVTEEARQGVRLVEVAHEAVLRHWTRYREWLERNREFLLWRRRLAVYLEGGSLLRDAPLAEAGQWLDTRPGDLTETERGYIGDSRAALEAEAAAREQEMEERRHSEARALAEREAAKRRLVVVVAGILVAISAGIGVLQWLELEAVRASTRPIEPENMLPIATGQFSMGSPANDITASRDERPGHRVHVKAFLLAQHEVTIGEFMQYVRATGADPPGDAGFSKGLSREEARRLPVVNVSWNDAVAYAAWLSVETGKRYRLPTEAEWEYAARAGTTTRRHWGDDAVSACRYANVFDRRNERWLRERLGGAIDWQPHACEDAFAFTAPVGSFAANPWDLHDMLGNVWEWVQDCSHDSYEGAPADGSAWLEAAGGDCDRRVLRGGAWDSNPDWVRSAVRNPLDRARPDRLVGFRLAQDQ
jgi:formylglycine-generating enzyme required for sulfatase activity